MRTCGWLLLILIAIGWIACRLPEAPAPPVRVIGGWRRTAEGWERRSIWGREPRRARPPVHPVVPTMLGACVSLMALVAFAPAARGAGQHVSPPAWHVSGERRRLRRTVLVERRNST